MDVVPDELAQVDFALHMEVATHPRELVRPAFRHFQRECPNMLFAHEFDFDFGAHDFPFVNGKAGPALRAPGSRLMVDLFQGLIQQPPLGESGR